MSDVVGWGAGDWGASAWGRDIFVRNVEGSAAGVDSSTTLVDGLAYANEGAQAVDDPAGQFLWTPVNNPQTPNWQQAAGDPAGQFLWTPVNNPQTPNWQQVIT